MIIQKNRQVNFESKFNTFRNYTQILMQWGFRAWPTLNQDWPWTFRNVNSQGCTNYFQAAVSLQAASKRITPRCVFAEWKRVQKMCPLARTHVLLIKNIYEYIFNFFFYNDYFYYDQNFFKTPKYLIMQSL